MNMIEVLETDAVIEPEDVPHGSIQTSITTLNHPELFSHVGVFSGFVQDPLTGYAEHLTPEKLDRYRNAFKLYFRAMGDQDPYLPCFKSDDELLAAQH